MNKTFKVINGKAVSELAKNKSTKLVSISLLSSSIALAIASGNVYADKVGMLGVATSESAVAIGQDSFSTAINGIANGKEAIATGNGFSREDFLTKKQENEADLNNIKNKQNEIANLGLEKEVNENLKNDFNRQINDITKKQREVEYKISERERLNNSRKTYEDKIEGLDENIRNAQNNYNAILNSGVNEYIDFSNVLNSLNWNVLNGSEESRDIVATELKNKLTSDFENITRKYEDEKYRKLIDGYINKQASIVGAADALASKFEEISENNVLYSSYNYFFSDLYANTDLNTEEFLTNSEILDYYNNRLSKKVFISNEELLLNENIKRFYEVEYKRNIENGYSVKKAKNQAMISAFNNEIRHNSNYDGFDLKFENHDYDDIKGIEKNYDVNLKEKTIFDNIVKGGGE